VLLGVAVKDEHDVEPAEENVPPAQGAQLTAPFQLQLLSAAFVSVRVGPKKLDMHAHV
jgi:hypothetical protein